MTAGVPWRSLVDPGRKRYAVAYQYRMGACRMAGNTPVSLSQTLAHPLHHKAIARDRVPQVWIGNRTVERLR